MKRSIFSGMAAAIVALSFLALPALAALAVGQKAPDFTAAAALNGKVFQFSLAQALAKGPVVLYFFPKSFTSGCSVEAHEFAEATDQFAALGATVIGVSTDDIATQAQFSQQVCQGKFAVAADPSKAIVKSFDAAMALMPGYANRLSYVIVPDSTVVYSYQSLDPSLHVASTLAAVRAWRTGEKGKTQRGK
ncbi:MAG: peroxiredoxin [Burkholderiaceae bacterium]